MFKLANITRVLNIKSFLTLGIKNKYLYTNIHSIKKELSKRRKSGSNDEALVFAKLTHELQGLIDEPHLVFFRQVATPLNETLEVLRLAKKLNLKPLILEYYKDKFVGKGNSYKKALGKLPIYKHTAANGEDAYENFTIVNFNQNVGKPFSEVKTITGEKLITFHHELFHFMYNEDISNICIDGSNWFAQFESNSKLYYKHFLPLFLHQNVLAEIFLNSGDEDTLTKKIVIPAFKETKGRFGIKPLILNYLPSDEQERVYWNCYPSKARDFLMEKGYI